MSTEPLKTPAISAARDYQTLPAWIKSMNLAEQVFAVTEDFPEREHAGLAQQLRQAAVYVASAIAAGSAGVSEEDISEYYREAQSALAEVSTGLALAERLKYLDAGELNTLLDEVSRLLIGLQHGLRIAARDAERAARDAARAERAAAPDAGERPFRKPYEKREGGEDRPRREYKPRDDRGGDRPYKKPYAKREDGDAPRREYKPRDRDDRGGDRGPARGPYKKPYAKRDGDERPARDGDRPFKKPYAKRDGDARPARDGGDRPYKKREDTRGDRQGYGGSKPYAKRDFGGKPKPRSRD